MEDGRTKLVLSFENLHDPTPLKLNEGWISSEFTKQNDVNLNIAKEK